MKVTEALKKDISHFERIYDENKEAKALASRGDFLNKFPINAIKDLKIEDYVTGRGTASFCNYVEAKTKAWATIQGSTSIKFGVYYGKMKPDESKKYRFAKKFGSNHKEAFLSVKSALVKLIKDAKAERYKEVDKNPLSQMFKAKVISLYFPEQYINICSEEHIEQLALEIGLKKGLPISEYQHLFLKHKSANPLTADWSNPKFMSFLYMKYIRENLYTDASSLLSKPLKDTDKEVDFDELQQVRKELGKISEDFALDWEKNRLRGLGREDLANKIKDKTKKPANGYDFLSFEADGSNRQIEVKSLGISKGLGKGGYRFFLSENEKKVSLNNSESYYFYMVQFGKDMKPADIHVKKADELYEIAELSPAAFKVMFSIAKEQKKG